MGSTVKAAAGKANSSSDADAGYRKWMFPGTGKGTSIFKSSTVPLSSATGKTGCGAWGRGLWPSTRPGLPAMQSPQQNGTENPKFIIMLTLSNGSPALESSSSHCSYPGTHTARSFYTSGDSSVLTDRTIYIPPEMTSFLNFPSVEHPSGGSPGNGSTLYVK